MTSNPSRCKHHTHACARTHRQEADPRQSGEVADLQREVEGHVDDRGEQGGVVLDGDAVGLEGGGGLQLWVGQLGRAPEEDEGGEEDGPDAEEVDELDVCVCAIWVLLGRCCVVCGMILSSPPSPIPYPPTHKPG